MLTKKEKKRKKKTEKTTRSRLPLSSPCHDGHIQRYAKITAFNPTICSLGRRSLSCPLLCPPILLPFARVCVRACVHVGLWCKLSCACAFLYYVVVKDDICVGVCARFAKLDEAEEEEEQEDASALFLGLSVLLPLTTPPLGRGRALVVGQRRWAMVVEIVRTRPSTSSPP